MSEAETNAGAPSDAAHGSGDGDTIVVEEPMVAEFQRTGGHGEGKGEGEGEGKEEGDGGSTSETNGNPTTENGAANDHGGDTGDATEATNATDGEAGNGHGEDVQADRGNADGDANAEGNADGTVEENVDGNADGNADGNVDGNTDGNVDGNADEGEMEARVQEDGADAVHDGDDANAAGNADADADGDGDANANAAGDGDGNGDGDGDGDAKDGDLEGRELDTHGADTDGEADADADVDTAAKDAVDMNGEDVGDDGVHAQSEELGSKVLAEMEDNTHAVNEMDLSMAQDDVHEVEIAVQQRGRLSASARDADAVPEVTRFASGTPDTMRDTRGRLEMEDRSEKERLNEMYTEATEEHEQLLAQRANLERKLANYFASKKTEEIREAEKTVQDQEQRYLKCLAGLDELRDELGKVKTQYDRASIELKSKVDEKDTKATEVRNQFMLFKREIALAAQNSRTGKPIPPKTVTQFEQLELKKDQDVHKVRLKNITLRNLMKKLEQSLRQKEELADGLHLIDFEQLKIENQTYNEKIEERNEELLKLRKKITNTVQVLTHLKEKLQFVQGENLELKRELSDLETNVAAHRDLLSKAKKDRDQLRMDNMRLRQQSGLVGADDLLRDFEQRKVSIR
eukprot:TRINITY_DN4261_c0_g2_i1.p1 TRINITY_DN4261_c0_g2~~TRINITY_DN4261_c0_g2_i1.p1  ORF type:complete len:631 (-),score=212.53 TRINITY_DN4261_c0_g2_i1:818-2710(-)